MSDSRPEWWYCKLDGCDSKAYTKGWCRRHYDMLRRKGEVTLEGRNERRDAGKRRWTESAPIDQSRAPGQCVVVGCEKNPQKGRTGMCHMHYMRNHTYGEVGPAEPVVKWGNRRHVTPDGYVLLDVDERTPSGRKKLRREHQIVMEQTLGRPLEPHESVHHLNGIRHDNRPDNLELWVTPPRKGQRPADLAEWVVEHYEELVVAALEKRTQLRLVV